MSVEIFRKVLVCFCDLTLWKWNVTIGLQANSSAKPLKAPVSKSWYQSSQIVSNQKTDRDSFCQLSASPILYPVPKMKKGKSTLPFSSLVTYTSLWQIWDGEGELDIEVSSTITILALHCTQMDPRPVHVFPSGFWSTSRSSSRTCMKLLAWH